MLFYNCYYHTTFLDGIMYCNSKCNIIKANTYMVEIMKNFKCLCS